MRALGKYIILEEIKEDVKKTEGGLLLAEKHREDTRYRRGVIKSVGDAIDVLKPADTIWFDRAAGHNIEFITGKVQKVIQERDVVIVE